MADFPYDVSDFTEVAVKKGYVLFEQGSFGTTVFILKEGIVAVEVGGNFVCDVEEPGSIFGEISVLLDCMHTARIVAQTKCVLYLIKDFEEFCLKHPKNAYEVSKTMARRVSYMNLEFTSIKEDMDRLQNKKGALTSLISKFDKLLARPVTKD